jgi:Right handed beta helix region
MQRKSGIPHAFKHLTIIIFSCLYFIQCSEEELTPSSTIKDPTISALSTSTTTSLSTCGCTYTVPPNTGLVDGQALGIKPGAVICLTAGAAYANITFKNLKGTSTSPITITNCGGLVTLNATGKAYGLKTQYSSYIRITGGNTPATYGIKINGGQQSMQLEALTTNIEVDHLEIGGSGFAGIMAKTDPTCDNATIRGNFVMRNVYLHDNYVHDTGGEALYVGNSFWINGMSTSCGTRYPHAVEGAKIYNNIIKNSGREAIQVGSSPTGAEVYNNRIENYGLNNLQDQNHGVQFGEGGVGKFYGNFIKGGKGNGLMIIGNGENFAHDNVIINAGGDGIFCEDRVVGAGYTFINNTIINPGANGIRTYGDQVTLNTLFNNIIVNPGNYTKMTTPRTGNDAYIYILNSNVKTNVLNNYLTRDINALKFVDPAIDNFALTSTSPAVNKGTSISLYNIQVDFAQMPRLKGGIYDIGAYEAQ